MKVVTAHMRDEYSSFASIASISARSAAVLPGLPPVSTAQMPVSSPLSVISIPGSSSSVFRISFVVSYSFHESSGFLWIVRFSSRTDCSCNGESLYGLFCFIFSKFVVITIIFLITQSIVKPINHIIEGLSTGSAEVEKS